MLYKNLKLLISNLNLLMIIVSAIIVTACNTYQSTYKFGYETPVKEVIFDAPFPKNLIYQATPNAKIIVGKKDVRRR